MCNLLTLVSNRFAAILVACLLAACGGGGEDSSPAVSGSSKSVTVSWVQSRETGVNSPGGGYLVIVDSQSPIDVPYVAGPSAPTSIDLNLVSGSHSITVRAYAQLDASGGNGGSMSVASAPLVLSIP